MKDLLTFRSVFQFFAVGVFVYQMQNSFKKYYDHPMVQQSSILSFDKNKIKIPLMYICQDSEFDYVMARNYGYYYLWQVLVGKLHKSNNFTWKGKFENQTFVGLQNMIFNFDNDHTVLNSQQNKNDNWQPTSVQKIFIPPFGFCTKVGKSTGIVWANSTTETNIFLVDPALENNIRISSMKYGTFKFGPSGDGFFEEFIYEVELRVYDSSVDDGITCVNYERTGSRYGECIENMLQEKFLLWFGCLPPWFSNDLNNVCDADMHKVINDVEILQEIENEFVNLVTGYELDMFKECFPPCQNMQLDYNLRRHIPRRLDYANIRLMLKDEVTVFTYVHAYDWFNLLVDLGSALGLWLGLSVLSIFDSILELYSVTRSKCHP